MNLRDKIIHCLDLYPTTRNSDILLTRAIWFEFHSNKLFDYNGKKAVLLESLMDLPREDHVKRIRAKIQNEEKRFLPTDLKILKQRKLLAEEWRFNMMPSNPARG